MDRSTARRYSVEDRLRQFGDAALQRLAPHFHAAGITPPPHRLAILAFKDQRLLEVHAAQCEDLFTLAAATSPPNVMVVIAPTDLRRSSSTVTSEMPRWMPRLYAALKEQLAQFPQSGNVR